MSLFRKYLPGSFNDLICPIHPQGDPGFFASSTLSVASFVVGLSGHLYPLDCIIDRYLGNYKALC